MYTQGQSTVRGRTARKLARGLGWFSIGLGLAELLAPRAMARATGLRRQEALMQAYGLREIATGIGLLASRQPRRWMWARVGGDVLDLATLSAAGQPRRLSTASAIAAVASVAAADLACARALQAEHRHATRHVRDYSTRSGLPRTPDQMRGAALADFKMPDDMRAAPRLRQVAPA
jgi:hypothetical protein